jgi:hypothetical protein
MEPPRIRDTGESGEHKRATEPLVREPRIEVSTQTPAIFDFPMDYAITNGEKFLRQTHVLNILETYASVAVSAKVADALRGVAKVIRSVG